jgi:hypothetical protein
VRAFEYSDRAGVVTSMIRTHLRSNVVGYLALFVALSGTAVALPATNTVFGDDIVNGEVSTKDISDSDGVRSADVRDDDKRGGGLSAIDLAQNSVGASEITADGVGSSEIKLDAVRRPEIAADGVGASEIAADGVGALEIAADGVGTSEIASHAITGEEIFPHSITGEEIRGGTIQANHIADGGVGAQHVAIYERESVAEQEVADAIASDGFYGEASINVQCDNTSQLLGATIDWTDTNGQQEAMLSEVTIRRDLNGADVADVTGVFDGGGNVANPGKFIAVATCLAHSTPVPPTS